MTFAITVKNAETGDSWEEIYDKPEITSLDAAKAWATKTVAWFNCTLRPGEYRRVLVDVLPASEEDAGMSAHTWEKQNLVTLETRGNFFDKLRCKVCGITAKRYGFAHVKRDHSFRAEGFASCARSIELLKKIEKRAKP